MSMFRRGPRIESKTDDQLRAMRRAGLVVADTLALALKGAVAGTTTRELDAAAEDAIRGAGAVPSFLGYHGFTGSLCISVNDEVVHGVPGERVLQEGDLVSIDCGAIVDGWHGDAAITLVVGGREQGSQADLALMDDTQASLWDGLAALRAGGRLFAVGDAVEDCVEAALERRRAAGVPVHEYGILQDFVGHGIGREMHMDPQVPNYGVAAKGPSVPSGATLAVEPMVTLGTIKTRTLDDDWTVVTTDGSHAAHWEHTVAVTDAGLWVLTAHDGGEAELTARGAPFAPLTD
ncbi:type I methionyl aminopeptidase [Ornithinimicrobium pratense]|uniref:Methionine aminopeptidase n=1 Tax=Ornithinimicrobium pratense TaxID=2593973 RepID=A0A5J6V8I2_9MICO|nr:type I methionyl aminopeptidase [Ornithinimicrobium pratense]QFG69302.1 type I methionyl aminopeptidase [Ornithinimicrobium pratense]